MEYVWNQNMLGICMEYERNMLGICMEAGPGSASESASSASCTPARTHNFYGFLRSSIPLPKKSTVGCSKMKLRRRLEFAEMLRIHNVTLNVLLFFFSWFTLNRLAHIYIYIYIYIP